MKNNKVVFLLDFTMLLAICGLEAKVLTGVPVHEWLGVALGAVIVVHLLLQWPWIESQARRLFSHGAWRARANYFLNLVFFVCMIATIVSGMMISEHVLPIQGRQLADSFTWHSIHGFAGHAIMFIAGLHLALNWDWIIAAIRGRIQPRPATVLIDSEQHHTTPTISSRTVRGMILLTVACGIAGAGTYGIKKSLAAAGFHEEDAYTFARGADTRQTLTMAPPGSRLPDRFLRDRSERPDSTGRVGMMIITGQPSLKFGYPAFVMTVVIVALSALAGRKVLRIRL